MKAIAWIGVAACVAVLITGCGSDAQPPAPEAKQESAPPPVAAPTPPAKPEAKPETAGTADDDDPWAGEAAGGATGKPSVAGALGKAFLSTGKSMVPGVPGRGTPGGKQLPPGMAPGGFPPPGPPPGAPKK
jgi:hypothetical protein